MAISRIQPLLLLASLFFLPALSIDVNFEYCNKKGYDIAKVNRVVVFSKPGDGEHLNIILFGLTKRFIRRGSFIEVSAKSEENTENTALLKRFDICKIGACPIIFGLFERRLEGIPKYQLEGDFKYEVTLIDESSEKPSVIMCINFSFPTSALKMVST